MNPFGDDPDWVSSLDDDPFDGDGDEENEGGGGRDPSNIGAQHIVLLIDCNDSMFDQYVPCLCLSDHMEDSEGSSSSSDDDDDHVNDDDGGNRKLSPNCTYVSPMDVAITAAHRYLRTKIRDVAETKSGKRDGVGVLLYGCDPYRAMGRGMGNSIVERMDGSEGEAEDEKEDDDTDDDEEDEDLQPSTHELIELAAPGIEQILAIQECLPREHNSNRKRRNLQSEFSSERNTAEMCNDNDGDSNVCSLLQGLTATLKIFGSAKCVKNPTPASKQLPDSKSVWIFTNQDDPCHGDEAKNTRIHMVTRDFQEAGVAIHVLPLPKKSSSGVGTSEFDHTIFYSSLASSYGYGCAYDATDSNGIVDVEAILDRFDIGTKKRRKYATLPLLLPGWKERNGDTGIMLDLYGTVSIRSKPQKIPVHQENNRMTTRRTIRIITDSGEEVQPENLHHSANFCGSRVSLQPANVAIMKRASNSQDRASLVIHGFRPMTQFSATNLLSKTVLATPNDARVNGSGRALYNLKQSMLKKNVFAVGELLVRASATSKMVAVVPKAGDGVEGLHIIHIPFKEDVRAVNEKDIGIAERISVDAAKRLISKSVLHFDDFASCLPENPYLKHFFGYLESVSLGKPLGPVEDDAKMDVQQMLESAGEEIESFSNCLPNDEQLLQTERKRKAPPPSLKQEFKNECIGQEWLDLYENDEIATLKSDDLKAFLKSQGERLAGKKADLVDRVKICIRKEVLKDV